MYCCRRNRGYGTVHVLILMTAILTIVASVSVLTSIAIKGAASDELKTRLEVLGYDLFEITDEIVEEQMAEAYRRAFAEQQKRFAAGAQETDDAKKRERFLRDFVRFGRETTAKRIETIFSENAASIRSILGLHLSRASVEYAYYDASRKIFVTSDDPPSVSSTQDISLRVELTVQDEDDRRYSFAKYYYFNFDRKIEAQEEGFSAEDMILGEIFYGIR